MSGLLRQSLLVLIIFISMIPTPVRAGSVGSDGALPAPLANPAGSDQIPGAVTMPLELKPSDFSHSDNSAVIPTGNAGQTTKEPPSSPKNETTAAARGSEGGRTANLALIIAFGISLALNIYLLITLFARRKSFK